MSDEGQLRVLWKYPRLVARLLYGESDPGKVTEKVVEFTHEFCPDMEEHIPLIRRVLPGILAEEGDASLPPRFSKGEWRAGYEASYAEANYHKRTGRCSDEALLLWVALLSHGTPDPERVDLFGHTLTGIGRYALVTRRADLLPVLWAMTFDLMMAYTWAFFAQAAFGHVYVSVGAGWPAIVEVAFRGKAASEEGAALKYRGWSEHWSQGYGGILEESFDWMYTFMDRGPEAETIENEVARSFSWIARQLGLEEDENRTG